MGGVEWRDEVDGKLGFDEVVAAEQEADAAPRSTVIAAGQKHPLLCPWARFEDHPMRRYLAKCAESCCFFTLPDFCRALSPI